MNIITRNTPNAITCLNIAAGVLSIIAASQASNPMWGLKGFQWAFIFIAIGALADFLDGLAARVLRAYSDVGKELDSLCDVVTFGVAPALIIFYFFRENNPDAWVCWTSFLIPICAALRLARFNIDTRQTTTFIGLPVPANAIFWIGYVALAAAGVQFLYEWYVFLPIMVVECWLMNSPVKMFSLKFTNLSISDNLPRYLLVVAAAVFCFSLGVGGLLWLIIFYILLSITFKNK